MLDVIGDDEVQLLIREPVVRRQHPVDFVEDGLGQAWPKLLASKLPSPLTHSMRDQPFSLFSGLFALWPSRKRRFQLFRASQIRLLWHHQETRHHRWLQ